LTPVIAFAWVRLTDLDSHTGSKSKLPPRLTRGATAQRGWPRSCSGHGELPDRLVDEGGDQMVRYRFEIVRRAFGRFGWILVDQRRGRRVLARSERSWRSKKRVARAIKGLAGADVVDRTNGRSQFQLPNTSFHLLTDVVPLIVEERGLRGRRRGRTAQRG